MGIFRRARLMRWLSFLLVMGCMAPGIRAGSALAVPLLLPNLPDFYQHQKAGAGWNVENDAAITFKSGAPFLGIATMLIVRARARVSRRQFIA